MDETIIMIILLCVVLLVAIFVFYKFGYKEGTKYGSYETMVMMVDDVIDGNLKYDNNKFNFKIDCKKYMNLTEPGFW